LTRLETRVALANHEDLAAATHDLAIAMTRLGGFQRGQYFHDTAPAHNESLAINDMKLAIDRQAPVNATTRQRGRGDLAASVIAEKLGLPNAMLTFELMNDLIGYLTDECCRQSKVGCEVAAISCQTPTPRLTVAPQRRRSVS
jgi:hypothetical protein